MKNVDLFAEACKVVQTKTVRRLETILAEESGQLKGIETQIKVANATKAAINSMKVGNVLTQGEAFNVCCKFGGKQNALDALEGLLQSEDWIEIDRELLIEVPPLKELWELEFLKDVINQFRRELEKQKIQRGQKTKSLHLEARSKGATVKALTEEVNLNKAVLQEETWKKGHFNRIESCATAVVQRAEHIRKGDFNKVKDGLVGPPKPKDKE